MKTVSTIVAHSTPSGPGALAIIRLSGPDAIAIAAKMARFSKKKKRLEDACSHTIHLGYVIDGQGDVIDQVMFSLMRAPATFTGENVIEISCHNNQFIIEAIIQRTIELGAQIAERGEFSQRAFEHGKISLDQAEAINELISAQTEAALKRSLAQLSGSLSRWAVDIESDLLHALALCEASFEFLEGEHDFSPEIRSLISKIIDHVALALKTYDIKNQLRTGIRIALIGSVNAGKSSLFNYLLGHNRAIVTPQAGTTRDTVEAGMYRQGNYWTLIDTAGIRNTTDVIEQEGIKRSLEEAQKADIVILAADPTQPPSPELNVMYDNLCDQFASKIIPVLTKKDLVPHATTTSPFHQTEALSISTVTGDGCDQIMESVHRKISELLGKADAPFLLNKRHYGLLVALQSHLHEITHMLSLPTVHHELVAHHLRIAIEQLGQVSGRNVMDAAVDHIFREFCIGK